MLLKIAAAAAYYKQDKGAGNSRHNIPLRLLDCFGFTTPLSFLIVVDVFELEVFRFFVGEGKAGSGSSLKSGEAARKAVGDGMVIVSISANLQGGT
jgi:hypothetical protein